MLTKPKNPPTPVDHCRPTTLVVVVDGSLIDIQLVDIELFVVIVSFPILILAHCYACFFDVHVRGGLCLRRSQNVEE